MSIPDEPEVMSIRQASNYLGMSPETVYKYVSWNSVPAFKLGNRWRFKKTLLDAWMERESMMQQRRKSKKRRRQPFQDCEEV